MLNHYCQLKLSAKKRVYSPAIGGMRIDATISFRYLDLITEVPRRGERFE